MNYIIFGIVFVSLYFTLVWLNFLLLEDSREQKHARKLPLTTVIIPAYNEEKTLSKSLRSILRMDYPKEKLEVIIVNDGSTDNTKKVAERLIKKYNKNNIKLINKKNAGKAAALNTAISAAKGELIGCLDADSRVDPDALNLIIPHFDDKKMGAVITAIKVDKPKNMYEKVQRVEYIFCVLMRKLMSSIDTLAMTPGVLSVYRADVLKKIGGFDASNMSEDFEIAMRLKYHGYNVKMESNSITYTKVPDNFSELWRQRIRWFRGFIYNNLKYKDMFFKKKYSIFGYFQLPLNLFSVILLLTAVGAVSYVAIINLWEFLVRSVLIKDYFLGHFITFPTMNELILGQNLQVTIPIAIISVLGIYMVYIAHKQIKERFFVNLFSLWVYVFVFPYLTSVHWVSAIVQEMFRIKRKW